MRKTFCCRPRSAYFLFSPRPIQRNELILDTFNGVSLKEIADKINVNECNIFNTRHKLLVSLDIEERPKLH